MAVSYHEKEFPRIRNGGGLYLRTVHGNAKTPFVAGISPLQDGKACTYRIEAHPEKVELKWEEGMVTLAYADSDTLLISGEEKGPESGWISFREAFDFIQPVFIRKGYLVSGGLL